MTARAFAFRFSLLFLTIQILAIQALLGQCPPGDVQFTSQAQVDAFTASYPLCTTISGNLEIGPSSDITDLSPLYNLDVVSGTLSIHDNAALQDANGVTLTSVGSIQLNNNPGIQFFYMLENVSSSSMGFFDVHDNTALLIMKTPYQLSTLSGDLHIYGNTMLDSIAGFNQLTAIGGNFQLSDSKIVYLSDQFQNLQTLGGDFSITGNSFLTELLPFSQLVSFGGALELTNNPMLSLCSVQSICNYLAGAGPATISGNATGCASVAEIQAACIPWYADADGDGYGDPAVILYGTTQPSGYVSDNSDCDDNNNAVHPGATELCNTIDDDCNGLVDDGAGCQLETSGNGNPVYNRSQTTSPANGTDFGMQPIGGGTATSTFTLGNTSLSAPLTLTGVPLVTIAGEHAADFTVTSQPVSPIAPNGNTTFTVLFNPSGPGYRWANVVITHTATAENPFVFVVSGVGQ